VLAALPKKTKGLAVIRPKQQAAPAKQPAAEAAEAGAAEGAQQPSKPAPPRAKKPKGLLVAKKAPADGEGGDAAAGASKPNPKPKAKAAAAAKKPQGSDGGEGKVKAPRAPGAFMLFSNEMRPKVKGAHALSRRLPL
jgi:hypothetical protein